MRALNAVQRSGAKRVAVGAVRRRLGAAANLTSSSLPPPPPPPLPPTRDWQVPRYVFGALAAGGGYVFYQKWGGTLADATGTSS